MNCIIRLIAVCTAMFLFAGCTRNPKVIEPTQSKSSDDKTGIFSQSQPSIIPDNAEPSLAEDIHTVVVQEVLPTVKYVYLRVREGNDEFWIATIKREVDVGRTYYYQGGLLKTNFESREHKRVFDRMFLVSSIIEADHVNNSIPSVHQEEQNTRTVKTSADPNGSTEIADLVANPERFEGKIVQVSGQCVKSNPNIMGRNWLHIKDGSKDDFDLVITSGIDVPVGHTITMKGKVVLNKDFGAGYRYAILLEDSELVR